MSKAFRNLTNVVEHTENAISRIFFFQPVNFFPEAIVMAERIRIDSVNVAAISTNRDRIVR